ncbi:MAG: protein kinase [Caldilineales bacterium]|nr:protein kinase [Caldilineales bacterium]
MSEIKPGTVIGGRYRIDGTIGAGAMTRVYRALDIRSGRFVTLKLLGLRVADNQEYASRFRREAELLSRLNHPGIVHVYEVGEDTAGLFIVLEYVDGVSLAERLSSQPFPLQSALEIIRQVAGALDYLHGHGIVHRDIKPSNILLAKDGRVFLTDLGSATRPGPSISQIGTVLGTPVYMSPEQVRGEPLDFRTDIYSLGVVLYQLLAARLPFEADRVVEILHRVTHEPPPSLRQFRPDVSPALEQVIFKSLAKDRHQRFESAGAFAAAIEHAQARSVPSAGSKRRRVSTDRPPSNAAPTEPMAMAAPRGEEWNRSPQPSLRYPKSYLWAALAGIIAIAALLMALFAFDQVYPLVVLSALAMVVVSFSVAFWLARQRPRQGHGLAVPSALPVFPRHEDGRRSAESSHSLVTSETYPYHPHDADLARVLSQAPEIAAFLLVLNGPQRGQRLQLLGQRSYIGRDSELNQVCIQDLSLSRQHACIGLEDGKFLIYDMNSTNGTYVNGIRVQTKNLYDRDEIRLGETNLVFVNIATNISHDAKKRLNEFDGMWDDLRRAAHHG